MKTRGSEIENKDVSQFLRGLARLMSADRYGNEDLSFVLSRLAAVFQRQPDSSPMTTIEGLEKAASTAENSMERSGEGRQPDFDLLKQIGLRELQLLVESGSLPKKTLIAIAHNRFAVPASSLKRLQTSGVRNKILSIIRHQISLESIAAEARAGRRDRE